ncbi:thioesterase family protein [Roseomonas sp. KE2513]|uniref:acyl-CoA thioesterase n=1 Tax=Roseomonas sp. KE2513 TaxID=2479202 RepID=UPI0018DFA9E9|nr:acyl-CoA thioesterase [Roseomonas sp. KE2513]
MSDFVRSIPVRWNDCDPAGIVFHAHYVRWMDEGFHDLALVRGVDFRAMEAMDPNFRSSPLVDIGCAFRAPAQYGDLLDHRIAPPEIGSGRAFRVLHRFYKGETLVAEGHQVRIWAMAGPGGEGLRAIVVPGPIAAKLRGDDLPP